MGAPLSIVTGGAGFIGLHLVARLAEQGRRVIVVDDHSREHSYNGLIDQLRVSPATAARIEFLKRDLTEPLVLGVEGKVEELFHLAATVGVRKTTGSPAEVLRNNLLSTAHTLDWAVRAGCRRVCLASSSEVYLESVHRGLAALPTAEDVPLLVPAELDPRFAYAASKLASEQLVQAYAIEHGLIARIVRFHNVYGPRMGKRHVIPEFILRALRGEDPFRILGAQRRAFCYVDDATQAMIAVTRRDSAGPLTVHIGNDREEIEIVKLAREITVLAGYQPKFTVEPAPPLSPSRRLPDLTRLRRIMHFEPTTLGEGLRRTFDWYRAEFSASNAPGD